MFKSCGNCANFEIAKNNAHIIFYDVFLRDYTVFSF